MTTCSLKTCEIMAKEKDVQILLCYYNELIKKLNTTSATSSDYTCISTLAAQINATLRGNIRELSVANSSTIQTPEVVSEFNKLLNRDKQEDAEVIKDMYQSTTIILVILFFILLTLYKLL